MLSALLHGLVLALILVFTYVIRNEVRERPVIFELVAGEGDNYAATVAPLAGTPGGVQVKVPEIAVPEPTPQRPSEPVVERAPPPPPKTAETAPTKAVPELKPPTFEKDLVRIANKRQAKVERQFRAEQAKKAKEEAQKSKRMTLEEFYRQNRGKSATVPKAGTPKISKIDTEGISKGVAGGSASNKVGGAGGKALTREEATLLDLYMSLLKQKLRDALEKPPGLADSLVAVAEIRIASDGTLSGRIARSSGNAEFDRAVLDAIKRVRSIGATPNRKSDFVSIEFRMKEE